MSRADRLLGSLPVAAAGRLATRRMLRVLAMHGVEDLGAFATMLDRLVRVFTPVGSTEVLDWFHGARDLPRNAIWLTFDDGDRTTIVDAAPVLARRNVSATAFICPGLVEQGLRPWWEVVLSAGAQGHAVDVGGRRLHGQDAVRALKSVADEQRRSSVLQLAEAVGIEDENPVTAADLHRWREYGGEIGNHTWDHPCLDKCTAAEQESQIDRAAAWLDDTRLWDRRLFAYPNGDRTDHAEAHLRRSGYDLVALFDHHLSNGRDPLRVSRLRIDSNADPARAMAVTSGWHSALMAARDRGR